MTSTDLDAARAAHEQAVNAHREAVAAAAQTARALQDADEELSTTRRLRGEGNAEMNEALRRAAGRT